MHVMNGFAYRKTSARVAIMAIAFLLEQLLNHLWDFGSLKRDSETIVHTPHTRNPPSSLTERGCFEHNLVCCYFIEA